MTSQPRAKLMTAEEFLDYGEDGYRYDLFDGRVVRMSPAGRRGRIAIQIASLLNTFVSERGLGEVNAAEAGSTLARSRDVVLGPDVSFVGAGRLIIDVGDDGFLPLVPDFAVEVISPSERVVRIRVKVQKHLDAGVPLLVLLHPRRRQAAVYRNGIVEMLGPDDVLDGGDVLPGLRLPLAGLFQ